MKEKHNGMKPPSVSTTLMPIAVDVDLIRFEKNLLQIGFFGANDARDKNRNTRRVEQTVIRNGSKIKVAAEFRGSEALGLPSTTDRDKFIALLKLVSEERVKSGVITNPIRFSGYRLIQELGLSRNGEIYEEIHRWGKRMTDTTITSEQVVYRAAKKVYSDETLHVFRSFRRTGSSNLNGTERQENYEVVLEDWLLENLNQRYVVPEDFNAYKQLTRPTAKGIFGNLHLWFHASSGRPVEKDYADLCNLLNVQVYPHLSKIKSTMGLALNELVTIRYLSKWDVQKMSSKQGYKVVLTPGEELLRILDSTRPEKRDQPSASSTLVPSTVPQRAFSAEEEEAETLLKQYGVLPAKASSLVVTYGASTVIDTVEALAASALGGGRKHVSNPAGLIIYSLENGMPVPAGFVSSRKRQAVEDAERQKSQEGLDLRLQELAYSDWVRGEQERLVQSQFSQEELEQRLIEISERLARADDRFQRLAPRVRNDLAERMLHKELSANVTLPSFSEWQKETTQRNLF